MILGPSYVSTLWLIFFGSVLGVGSFIVLNVIYNEQKSPYIDEIFHVPQAQLYCKNQWLEWNPKITTLPGLYLVSYLFLKPLEKLGYESFCSLYFLRITNLIATILNFYLAFKIIKTLESRHKMKTKAMLAVLSAFNIAIFPPLYFFTFLYYTDVWSLVFVLLTYYSNLRKRKIVAMFGSLMAVLMRQTNIIWVGLMIINEIWNVMCTNFKVVEVQDYKYTIKILKNFVSDYLGFKKSPINLMVIIISKTYHYIIICLLFVSFVLLNGSIVLGDKQAHTVTFHPMQNLYFINFLAFFGSPFFLQEAVRLLKRPPNIFLTILFMGLSAGLSEFNKLEHLYLLADNRHIAFYLWKRLFGHPIIRRMLVPTYILCGILLIRLLQKRCHFMFMVALAVCTVLNLTPQYLFELRYFIIPYVFCRLHFKQSLIVLLETLFFILINFGVLYLFLNRTFVWPSEPNENQRFIW